MPLASCDGGVNGLTCRCRITVIRALFHLSLLTGDVVGNLFKVVDGDDHRAVVAAYHALAVEMFEHLNGLVP